MAKFTTEFILKQILGSKKTKNVPEGFWINDSDDGAGEEHQVYKYGYNKDQDFGVWVYPDKDFYPMSDLDKDDIEGLLDHLNDTLNKKN